MDDGETRSVERAAHNERTFREANERIEATRQALGVTGPVPYICECEREACTELVLLDGEAYSEARARPRQFLIARGHPAREARVVEDRGSYVLVERTGETGDKAERP